MSKLSSILAAAAIVGASVLPLQSAQAWGGGGPWGSNMFGMDMGQSRGGYPGGPGGYGGGPGGGGFQPWGSNMFGMDMGQSGGYPGGGYYGAPYGGGGYPIAPRPAAPMPPR